MDLLTVKDKKNVSNFELCLHFLLLVLLAEILKLKCEYNVQVHTLNVEV